MLREAVIAFNRREWQFNDYEGHVAFDLVHRSRWPDTVTGQER